MLAMACSDITSMRSWPLLRQLQVTSIHDVSETSVCQYVSALYEQALVLCRTYSFLALVVLLRCPPEQLLQQGQDASVKFSDLVVKCLIKLTKALHSTLQASALPHV